MPATHGNEKSSAINYYVSLSFYPLFCPYPPPYYDYRKSGDGHYLLLDRAFCLGLTAWQLISPTPGLSKYGP